MSLISLGERMEETMSELKPLGFKNYGSIGHLPCSRMGSGDHSVHEGQASICLTKKRDKHDRIWVTEKLDGSNTGVCIIDGEVIALGRAGYRASTSKYEQHQLFAYWVRMNQDRFRALLQDGERCVGEWLAQAHGTRYELPHEPFVIFDLMESQRRLPWEVASERIQSGGFVTPHLLNDGISCMSIEDAMSACAASPHGAEDVEGAVWRVERNGQFDFMAKFVKPTKVDGSLLPEMNGGESIWNWKPDATVSVI